MKRRDLFKATLASTAALAAPAIVRAEDRTTVTFIPQADPASIDPVWTTADVTRNFSLAVFDTLYGVDASATANGGWPHHLELRQAVGHHAPRRFAIPR